MLHNSVYKLTFLLSLIAIIFICYLPGVSGSFYYDDIKPISQLLDVHSFQTAWHYVFTEESGPLGRPITMLTFLFNTNDWPDNLSAFFYFNITLHCLNGLLVFVLSYLISKTYQGENKKNYWIAIVCSAFWMVLPIQVTTSLIAIQRMAGVSAFWVFIGLTLYTYGLYKQKLSFVSTEKKNQDGLTYQIIGLCIGTLLAMFSKESGVLLPIFILVLELTLFSDIKALNHRKRLRVSICSVSLIAIVLYMIYLAIMTGNILPRREFTLIERITTQPQILFDYFTLAIFPSIEEINPFHDNYPHVEDLLKAPKALLSILLTIALLFSAIKFRHKYKLYSFSILWFFSAHLLESTIISLELFFEHRNYVALFGPCLALGFSLTCVTKRYQKIALFSAACYWLILAVTLNLTAGIWGEPQYAAQVWHNKQVGSSRAVSHLSGIFVENKQYLLAEKILEQQLPYCATCINLHVQAVTVACLSKHDEKTQIFMEKALAITLDKNNTLRAAPALSTLLSVIKDKLCTSVSLTQLELLNANMLVHPKLIYQERLPLLFNLYEIALLENEDDKAIKLLKKVWSESEHHKVPDLIIEFYIQRHEYELALDFTKHNICPFFKRNNVLTDMYETQCNKRILNIEQLMEVQNKRRKNG